MVLLIVSGVLLALFMLLGYGMLPHLMSPSLRGPRWLAAADADQTLSPDEDVIGVEINGDARAYLLGWSFRPHIVEDTVGESAWS